MRKLLPILCALCVFAAPCEAGGGAVVSSVANCRLMGGYGYWSNPALWTPMQVPDNNRPPGTVYEVSVPRDNCPSIYLDMPVTINRLWDIDGLYNEARKPAKLSGHNVSLTVLGDARIDELGMTNAKLTIGGLLWISGLDGWGLTDSKVKTQNYRQDMATGNTYRRCTIETAGTFLVTQDAWTYLKQSTLETLDLELANGWLSLEDGSVVKVKGNFKLSGGWAGLSVHLNAQTSFTVEGNALLGGYITGSFAGGYTPTIGEEFPILRCKGTISGSWNTTYLPQLPADRAWSVIAAGETVSLKVVPAP